MYGPFPVSTVTKYFLVGQTFGLTFNNQSQTFNYSCWWCNNLKCFHWTNIMSHIQVERIILLSSGYAHGPEDNCHFNDRTFNLSIKVWLLKVKPGSSQWYEEEAVYADSGRWIETTDDWMLNCMNRNISTCINYLHVFFVLLL